MRTYGARAVIVLAVLLAGCSSGSTSTTKSAAAAGKFEPAPCPQTPVPVPALSNARCGVLVVPENRAKSNGRTIRLPIATIPAKSPTPAPDPIVHFAGGPGNDALLSAQTLVDAGVNKDRDLILMSNRGAALSQPSLKCPELDENDDAVLGLVYDAPSTGQLRVDAARQCRDRVVAANKGIDLSAYNTTETVADYNDLRKALGIKEWNVFGHSYGTDVALNFVSHYPQGVRSLVLDGVVPPDAASPSAWPWRSAEEGFDALFDACAQQPACAARYPHLSQTFTDLVNKLEANPLHTTATLPDGTQRAVVMDGGALANWMVRAVHNAADVPQRLDELAAGNPQNVATEWAQDRYVDENSAGTFSYGFHYGVTCSEWVPYTTAQSELDQAKQAFPGLPDSVLAQGPQFPFMREACGAWNVAKGPSSVREVGSTNVRTLMMSGTFDAQTGAQWADSVAPKLTNSLNLKFPGIAHGPFTKPCGGEIITSFWDNPASPDTSCLASVQVPAFVVG